MDMLNWEQKNLLSELIHGLKAAKQLQAELGAAPSPPPPSLLSSSSSSCLTTETKETLLHQTVSSYERAISMLKRSTLDSPTTEAVNLAVVPVANTGKVPESPTSINESPGSEEFLEGGSKDHNLSSKKRKRLPEWTEQVRISPERGLEGPHDDVFSWRKYGQKEILCAKYPRSYYRCTFRNTQGCSATKQVQRLDGDPTIFEVKYKGTHTCAQVIPPPGKRETKTNAAAVIYQNDLLDSLRTNLTVRTNGIESEGSSFPVTPPFYSYESINGDFGDGGDPSGEQKQRQQLQIRGPRPSPLSLNKDSHKIKKPPKLPASPPHRDQVHTAQGPALIYSVTPKVVHTNVVHRLTGISSGVFLEPKDELEEAAEFGGHAPGILSPSPAMLPTPSPGMFSPPGLLSPYRTCPAEYASVASPHQSAASRKSYDSGLVSTPFGSSSSTCYDVVVRSRRGDISTEDFISHLRAALSRRGISVHEDFDETDAVPECRLLIIFFTSTYIPCNLLNILERQRKEPRVLYPIFYGISPSDLITNSKYYERLFLQDEPKRWQAALQEITQMPGYVLTDKSESELIDEIVRDALKVLCFTDKENMIGMDTQVEEILSLLCIESSEVRSIGIWGTVGVGKTAIAEEIFRKISVQYETCVFLKEFHKDVEVKGHDAVREDFLSKVLEVEPHVIRISDIKTSFLKSRLQRKKVLLVLDDVNDFRDVDTFLGKLHYFGPGSRIIITSRNRHVFILCKIDHVYKVRPLDISKSLQILDRGTVPTIFSPEVYKTLSLELVKFSNGNPQVLQFCSKPNIAWYQLSQEAQKTSTLYIPGIFERSCRGLDGNERSIFLDIACFFRRMDKDEVAMLLDGCGFSAHVGLKSLVDKSLLTISHNMVDMVQFIQATGREIVRQESDDRPGDRSRLWNFGDIMDVFINNTGTSAIEGIFLDMSKLKVDANPDVFEKMCNLRLLKLYFSEAIENRGVSLPQGLEYLPSKLRLLHWEYYPISSLPQSFDPKNLVELNLPNSYAKKLWKGKKSLEKLRKMRLSYSYQLTKIPRLSRAPNLELLDLEGCNSLVSISQSLCHLKKLVILNLKDCLNLESVPSTVDLESLEVLNLSGCSKLKNFPETSPHVKELYMGGTMIQEIPPSIKNLVLLEKLDMENSRHLVNLPSSICKLKRLETLNLSGCSSLDRFPDLSRKMKCLKSLDLSKTAIKELPSSISYLTALEELRFVECKSLVRLPDNAWSLRFKVEFRQIDTEKFSKLWNRFGWLKKVQIS